MEHSVKFEIEILKITHCGSRFPRKAKFGHFTLFNIVLQGRAKKCTKNYNARAQPLFCSLNNDVPTSFPGSSLFLPREEEKKREDPGNEVDDVPATVACVTSGIFFEENSGCDAGYRCC